MARVPPLKPQIRSGRHYLQLNRIRPRRCFRSICSQARRGRDELALHPVRELACARRRRRRARARGKCASTSCPPLPRQVSHRHDKAGERRYMMMKPLGRKRAACIAACTAPAILLAFTSGAALADTAGKKCPRITMIVPPDIDPPLYSNRQEQGKAMYDLAQLMREDVDPKKSARHGSIVVTQNFSGPCRRDGSEWTLIVTPEPANISAAALANTGKDGRKCPEMTIRVPYNTDAPLSINRTDQIEAMNRLAELIEQGDPTSGGSGAVLITLNSSGLCRGDGSVGSLTVAPWPPPSP